MTTEMLLEDVLLDGQHYPELEVDVKWHVSPAEVGLRDVCGQKVTPDHQAIPVIDKVMFEDEDLSANNKLKISDYNFIRETLEKEMERC